MKICGASGPPNVYTCQVVFQFNHLQKKKKKCNEKSWPQFRLSEITIKRQFRVSFSEFEADVKLGTTHFCFQ